MNFKMKKVMQLGLCSLLLSNTACERDLPETTLAVKPDAAAEEVTKMTENENENLASSDQLTQQVNDAKTHLAAKNNTSEDAIVVREARMVHWGSGALGCPEDGKSYTHSIIPGVLVILEIDGRFYRYHGRQQGDLFYCPADRATPPSLGPGQEFM